MKSDKSKYEVPVDASPVKSFFVSMLTRDIDLDGAILDLLDNCVDGILRTKTGHKSSVKPYSGFWAEISFDKGMFSISDNCGGIPWDLHDYAFRMGRDSGRRDDVKGSVGIYGIGMKRAIFKMGRECLITTKNGKDEYEVEITPEWLKNETDWNLGARKAKKPINSDGTTILIGNLNPGISDRFHIDAKMFQSELTNKIATHYAFIIDKGFKVIVNGQVVKPKPTHLLFEDKPRGKSGPVVRPFIFQTNIDGVDVFLTIGFSRPLPSQDEVEKGMGEAKYSTIDAGWTLLCNDRAVLYCDKTELTGWGEAGLPRYHTQFIAISGIVEFKSSDAKKLPTTTTKRGIDASSRVYLQVKNKMREGMRLFIDYTNKWKGKPEEAKAQIESAGAPLSFEDIKAKAAKLQMNTTKGTATPGRQYKPDLPLPKRAERPGRRIAFSVSDDDFQKVSEYFFDDEDAAPELVGEKCFDLALREAGK